MSNELRKGTEIQFEDKTRTVYPVSLKQLRKLREAVDGIDFENESYAPDEKSIDGMVKAAQIILEKIDPEFAANYELVEDTIDVESFGKMLAAAMGADPNE